MRIFVTGATGTIGNHLVHNLLDSKHEVTIITRNRDNVANEWKDKVTIVEGNVTEKGDWMSQISNQNAIINLVGENIFGKRWTKNQKERLYNSRINSTKNLVNAIKLAESKPSVFVSVSGSDYYPPSKNKIYVETDEPGNGFLAELSNDWEQPALELEGTETRYVIFRMGIAFTNTGNSAERMFIPHKFFVGGWIGSGDQIYPWIHYEDFVGLLQWGVENDQIKGIFNGAAPEFKTMKELASIGGDIMNRWTWTWAPGFMLKLVLGERAKILLKGRAISSKKVVNAGYEFKYPDPHSALEDILQDF